MVNIYKFTFRIVALTAIALCFFIVGNHSVLAVPASKNLLKQTPIEVSVSLGNTDNELKYIPNQLKFTAGKRYKLKLNNPSTQKHYFTAKDFADAIWTQKVDAGNVEIKGAIHDLELRPQTSADWVFIPMKPGDYQLRCTIAGHAEAGMTGKITVE